MCPFLAFSLAFMTEIIDTLTFAVAIMTLYTQSIELTRKGSAPCPIFPRIMSQHWTIYRLWFWANVPLFKDQCEPIICPLWVSWRISDELEGILHRNGGTAHCVVSTFKSWQMDAGDNFLTRDKRSMSSRSITRVCGSYLSFHTEIYMVCGSHFHNGVKWKCFKVRI